MNFVLPLAAFMVSVSSVAMAGTVELYKVDAKGMGTSVGHVVYEDTPYGVLFKPSLTGLPAGIHGFHVHDQPTCGPKEIDGKVVPGGAAAGHWDPDQTGVHLGPYDAKGHKGDLPALYVAADGTAKESVLAPRLKAADLAGHSLMVHVHGDNYSDQPEKLGGGGARQACGVF